MRFAVSLLTVLGIASIIGTVLKQNEPYTNYIVQFGQFWFELFEVLGLYDVYHSVWFLLILLFLVTSTSLCVYRNSPTMLREMRVWREHATEKSLRAFSHQHEYQASGTAEEVKTKLARFLTARGFRFKTVQQKDGGELIAAKAGSYQRLGYIFTHVAIVVICVGGLIDGNVPFKIQELLGYKKVETLDIAASEVPAESRLSIANLSFRANMTLPEGTSADVAFMRMRDGYLVQELPFRVALKDFRIEHYATGQPKSFESDLVISDPDLAEPLEATISVNKPLIYKGIAIYQSDFQDGGSNLDFNLWGLFSQQQTPLPVKGTIHKEVTLGEGDAALTIEFDDFRKFNILNLSPDGKGKPHNVGPNVTFKVRDTQGQAREYVSYMQPLKLDDRHYFVSGMRPDLQAEFKYLRIPVDEDFEIEGFMRLRAVMMDEASHAEIARRLSASALTGDAASKDMKEKFESSVRQLLDAFGKGGYTRIASLIEESVPEKERGNAAQTYIKIINGAAFEAHNLARERAGKTPSEPDEQTMLFLQDSLNSLSDLFFYGTPFYLQLKEYEHREASGLQLTRSPGKNLVYTGSVLLVLGIFSMIYIRERRIWLLVKPDNRVLFAISSNRKNRDLDIEFARYQEQLQRLLA
ncbi:MAG: cytochrome C biogenesis protein [Betaproteobacteria bacterium HGW-Betaproteobacteria-8]|nr:MAG: cytochrome C biogenesis protein [Betaproteobacteria bacterium HGW-Betaproteobacteria-8]